MKHFGTDIIRGIDLYQSEGARQFCFPSHTVLSLLRGEMRVRAGEKIFSFAGSGIILIPSGRKTDLFCEQSAVFLLIRISPAFLMEAFTRDRLLTEVISSHELPELLTLVPDLAALVPLFLESAELNRLAVNRLLFTFLERLDHTLANLQGLAYLARQGARGYLYDASYVFTALWNSSLDLPAREEGIFSVFALGETARGVSILGGRYPLEGGELSPFFPLGVSNHFEGRPVRVSVEKGCLLVGWELP